MNEIGPSDAMRLRHILDAAKGNVEPFAEAGAIDALLEQGCDFDLDILPILARMVPTLPRAAEELGRAVAGQSNSRRARSAA
jgi:hypothetical protein